MTNYDTILYITDTIDEAVDDRIFGTKGDRATPQAMYGSNYNWDDPKLYSDLSFGKMLRDQIDSLGKGYSCKVTDFNKWVVVSVSYSDTVTGRTSEKTFLVVFQKQGEGMVLSTANKYRSISGVSQAVSYIRSASSALQSSAQQKL